MEDQENEEQEQQGTRSQIAEIAKEQLEEKAKQVAKKAGKEVGKKATQLLIKLLPILIKIAVIVIIAGILVGGIYAIGEAIVNVFSGDISTSIPEYVKIENNGIKMSSWQEIMNKIDQILKENDLDKKSLDMGSEEQTIAYLYKFMTASLSTQLPYIKENESKVKQISDIANKTQSQLVPLVKDLLNNKQEVNGIVKIKRQIDDKKIDLTYKSYKDFTKLIEENNEKNEDSVLNYFSLDEEWMLCIGKKTKITTIKDGKTEVQNIIEEVKVPYQTIVSQYSMPFEFFISLQLASRNAEYVSAVADLIQEDGEIELTIFESKESGVTTTTQKYKPVTTSKGEESSKEEPEGTSESKESTTTNKKPNTTTKSDEQLAQPAISSLEAQEESGGSSSEETPNTKEDKDNKGNTETKEEKVIGPEETHTTITTKESTIISVKVTKADVWVIKQNATYVKNNSTPQYPFGEDGVTTKLDDEEDKVDITENIKQEITKEEWIVDSENSNIKIEKEKFLGLWRNASGLQGLDYDPDGELVKYKLPQGLLSYESPIENILSSKELLYDQLERGENTQTHALLMRYLIQYYMDPDSAVEPDLSIFETDGFTEVSTIYGSTIQEKVWNTLRKAGFSEYATAAAMGNIHYISNGINSNYIEAGYTENDGGIGICKWTNINRGTQGRNTNLKNYATVNGKQWTDENIQIQFLLTELTGTGDAVGYATNQLMTTTDERYGRIWHANEWENAGDIETATKAFCYTFEKPNAEFANSSMSTRISLAEQYYNTYHGKEVSKDVIRYYQNDYANVPYGSKSIATSGCGPTAFAMVATHLTGTTITPADAIKWCGNKYYVKGAGTSWSYFNAAAKHFALPGGVKQTNSIQEVQQALQSGKLVISSQSKGLFTSGGHYILLTKMVDGKIYVNDPNKNNAIGKGYNNRAFTVEEISKAAKQYWIFQ